MTLPDTERWKRISPLLDELLDLDPPARAVRLDEVRADDPALAGDLATLLAGGERAEATRFLRDDALVGTSPPTLRGAQVGAYVIESPLGQGGSGSVWRARRTAASARAGPRP